MKAFNSFKGAFCVLAFLLLSCSAAWGQRIGGLVVDAETSEALVGASVAVKGAARGTATDTEGRFSLEAAKGSVLVVTLVGYETQEYTVGDQTNPTIALLPSNALKEVVVTALGISREKKSLGYAVQEVNGSDLDKARETNVVTALAGKIAGVTVVGNPSGIGSSARITIRGERSLNINANQPLFVVDGVPISNEFRGSSGRSNQDVDYGNGAGFVNPDDIESITVLKGAGATALYGSRGANGVIVINTKSGKGTKGIGVSVNSTFTAESVLRLPDYQNVYGQGLGGQFDFTDGNGGGLADGVDESWGPRMEGQLIRQFDAPTSNGFRGGDIGNVFVTIDPVNLPAQLAARGEVSAIPFVARPDNVRDFFETGFTQTHNVAVAGGNDRGDFRLSYTWLDQGGVVPNTDLQRNTVAFSGGYQLSSKLKARAVVNYIKNTSANRPNLSYGTENIMYLFNCWYPRNTNTEALKDYWQRGRVGLNQFNWNYNYHDNPYFGVYENTNGQDIDRVYGNVALTYEFNPNLSLMVRSGTDVSNEFRDRRRAYSTQRFQRGSYREENIFFQETNTDFLLAYNRPINDNIDLGVNLGGNAMQRTNRFSDVSAPELAVPGVYNLRNSRVALLIDNGLFEKKINSLYGSAQLGFNDYLYLDLAGRNDWSSTLPKDAWSYFYYSANLGLVLSDMLQMDGNGPLSFVKLRASAAQVGNDTDPYQLQGVYNATGIVLGNLPSYGEQSVLPNAELKPEISTAFEVGADLRFFENRIGLDATYYLSNSRNQIIRIPLSAATGYSSRVINAGLIQNQGVELMLTLAPIRKKDLNWDFYFNWSMNRSTVKELYTDPVTGTKVTNFVMADRYITVEAREGERMGDMYGIGFERVSSDPGSKYYDPTGAFVGQIVYNSEGKPVATSSRVKLGNYNPDWLAGIGSNFNWKGLSAGILFDFRIGGEVYSHTQTVGREGGMISETLEGRANGYDLSLEGNGVIGAGVVVTGVNDQGQATGFAPNTTKLSAREWHTSYTLGRRLVEGVIYDASFVKLRELRLGYNLPNRFWGKSGLRDVNISLVGRNLVLWTDVPHIDPETSSTSGGTVIPGVESVAIPSTRSYGLNLNFKF